MTIWINDEFQLSICGLHELHEFRSANITHLLSILNPDFAPPPVLDFFRPRRRLDLRFNDTIEDSSDTIQPSLSDIELLHEFGKSIRLGAGTPVHLLAHCHAGLSRSTAAAIFLLAQIQPYCTAEQIVSCVMRARPSAWPNFRMIELGDGFLRRQGALVAAVLHQYRLALARQPKLRQMKMDEGRFREIIEAERIYSPANSR